MFTGVPQTWAKLTSKNGPRLWHLPHFGHVCSIGGPMVGHCLKIKTSKKLATFVAFGYVCGRPRLWHPL